MKCKTAYVLIHKLSLIIFANGNCSLPQERQFQLGSAHEVQRFHRDVDETKDWIQEKDEALNNDDCGRDLRSVQALQRKHEGVYGDRCCLSLFSALVKMSLELIACCKWRPVS